MPVSRLLIYYKILTNCFKPNRNSCWESGFLMLNLGVQLKEYPSLILYHHSLSQDLNWFDLILKEKLQYEWNARNQITLWGPQGEILDYATKQWAGVVADYFKPRWEVFIRELEIALQEGRPFNKTTYETTVFSAVEEPFTYSTKLYSDLPLGIKRSIDSNFTFIKNSHYSNRGSNFHGGCTSQ